MNDPIMVTLGIADETYGEPMDFVIFDEGIKFGTEFTRDDLQIAYAVFMDLAEALNDKLQRYNNCHTERMFFGIIASTMYRHG